MKKSIIKQTVIFIMAFVFSGLLYAADCKNCAFLTFYLNSANTIQSDLVAKLVDSHGGVKVFNVPKNASNAQIYSFGLIPVSGHAIRYSRSLDLIDPVRNISICSVTGSASVVKTGETIALSQVKIDGVYNNPSALYQCSAQVMSGSTINQGGITIHLDKK